MKHKLILTAVLFCAAMVFYGKDAVVTIDANSENVNLEIISSSSGGSFIFAKHFTGKDAFKNKQVLFAYYPVSKAWNQKEISFRAEKDCTVKLSFKASQGTVLFDQIKVTGAELKNGDFEQGEESWIMIDFRNNDGPPEVVEEEGINKSKALKLISPAQTARQMLKLKAGQEVKIKYSFKEA